MFLQQCQHLNTPPAGCGASFVEQKEPLNQVRGCLCSILAWYQAQNTWKARHPPGSLREAVVPLRPTCQRLANDSKAMRQSACWPGDADPLACRCLVAWTYPTFMPTSACRENPGRHCCRSKKPRRKRGARRTLGFPACRATGALAKRLSELQAR